MNPKSSFREYRDKGVKPVVHTPQRLLTLEAPLYGVSVVEGRRRRLSLGVSPV